MRSLCERFGIDYLQFRALTRVALKNDLRRSMIASKQRGERKRITGGIPGQIIFYALYGVIFSGVLVATPDVFLGTNIIISYAIFTVAVTVLLEFSTVVTSPDDYTILGFQPVSSRTYFAARLTNLLGYIFVVMAAFGIIPSITLIVREHFNTAIGAALLFAIILAGVTTALTMVLFYGVLLRRFRAARLKRALSYLQLVASFVAYGGYLILPRVFDRAEAGHLTLLRKTLPVLLYPGSWYASWVDLAHGRAGLTEIVPALFSLVFLVVVLRAAAGRLSLEFAERLSALTTISSGAQPQMKHGRSWSPFRGKEARAVWLLVRGQFRSDQRFRMGVLAIVPMTLLYMVMAVMEGQMSDPFTSRSSSALVNMAVILFPTLLSGAMTRSDNYNAAWIFFATPSDREATVAALTRTVFYYFVVPYLAVFGVVMSIWVHNVAHVATHVLVLALISSFTMNVRMVTEPELPFSRPPQKGERAARMFFMTLVSVLFASAAIPLIVRFVYISATRTAGLIVGLWLLGYAVERLGRYRVRRRIMESEFAG